MARVLLINNAVVALTDDQGRTSKVSYFSLHNKSKIKKNKKNK